MRSNIKFDARKDRIIEMLERDGQVRVTQLAELLGVTTVTVRSDLDEMEEAGLLERVQGGAVQTSLSLYNREFQRRKKMNLEAKRRIGIAAADLIQDGDSLFINGGTTTYYATLELKKKRSLLVVTNAINVAIELAMCPSFTVILVGGSVNPYYSFVCGSEALEQLSRYKVNKAILSIDGINEHGITTIHPDEATIARTMIEHAKQRIIIADSSKVGNDGFVNICDLSRIDCLVTDPAANPAMVETLRASNVDIKIV